MRRITAITALFAALLLTACRKPPAPAQPTASDRRIAFEDATASAFMASPKAAQLLGPNPQWDGALTESFKEDGNNGTLHFSMEITGHSGRGVLDVLATENGARWQTTQRRFRYDNTQDWQTLP